MEKQTITITLEEYKELRDIMEDYQKLIGDYNLLYKMYRDLVPKETKTKKKQKIGFNTNKES